MGVLELLSLAELFDAVFEWAVGRAADAGLDLGKGLRSNLAQAAERWASQLPAELTLSTAAPLLPGPTRNGEVDSIKPAASYIQAQLARGLAPDEGAWEAAIWSRTWPMLVSGRATAELRRLRSRARLGVARLLRVVTRERGHGPTAGHADGYITTGPAVGTGLASRYELARSGARAAGSSRRRFDSLVRRRTSRRQETSRRRRSGWANDYRTFWVDPGVGWSEVEVTAMVAQGG